MTKQKKLVEIQLLPCSDGGYIVKQTFDGEPSCVPPQKYADFEHAAYAVNVARYVGELFGDTVKLVYGSDSAIISNPA